MISIDIMIEVIIFIFGLCVGSFLNVVVCRSVKDESFSWNRSHCPECHHTLAAKDLVPILSFFANRRHCRYCEKPIAWHYLLTELFTGILFVVLFMSIDQGWSTGVSITILDDARSFFSFLRDVFFVCLLIVFFLTDFRYYLIPDKIILPAVLLTFIMNLLSLKPASEMLFSGMVLASFFFIQFVVSRGRWVGGGDIRLGFLIGVMLGWPGSIDALLLSYVLGALVSVVLLLRKKKSWKSVVPYGTFLTTTAMMNILFGPVFLAWYLRILS